MEPVTDHPTPASDDGASRPGAIPPEAALSDATADPLAHLLEVLDLRPVDGPGPRGEDDVFEGDSVIGPAPRAYGGQVLAQAILAAARTVQPGRLIRPPRSDGDPG
jgi:acyl-CoA thioesterase II